MEYFFLHIIQEMNKYKNKKKGSESIRVVSNRWLEEMTFFADVWQVWNDWLILK